MLESHGITFERAAFIASLFRQQYIYVSFFNLSFNSHLRWISISDSENLSSGYGPKVGKHLSPYGPRLLRNVDLVCWVREK